MVTEGTVISIGNDASPRELTTRVSGTWTTPVALDASATGDETRIRPLTENLWFTINANDSGTPAFDFGPGSRTEDGGVTWAATPQMGSNDGLRDISIAPDGRLWALTHTQDVSVYTVTLVYYSDDDGDTWTLSTSFGKGSSPEQVRGWRIMCHPTDSNTIAVIGFSPNKPTIQSPSWGFILHTTNRGDDWTPNYDTDLRGEWGGFHHYHDAVMLSNGRIIAAGLFSVRAPALNRIYITDDFGATLTTVHAVADHDFPPEGIFVSEDESTIGVIFAARSTQGKTDVELWTSTDGGDSFALVSLDTELSEINVRSMASSSDTIYIGTSDEEIYQLTPVSSAGVWTQIDTGFPHSNIGDDHLGVVQSIVTPNTYISDTDGGIVFSGNSVDVSVNIPETPDPEDTIVVFSPFSAIFRGSPSGAIRRLIKL